MDALASASKRPCTESSRSRRSFRRVGPLSMRDRGSSSKSFVGRACARVTIRTYEKDSFDSDVDRSQTGDPRSCGATILRALRERWRLPLPCNVVSARRASTLGSAQRCDARGVDRIRRTRGHLRRGQSVLGARRSRSVATTCESYETHRRTEPRTFLRPVAPELGALRKKHRCLLRLAVDQTPQAQRSAC